MDKQNKAADDLEDLGAALTQIVHQLRMGVPNDLAYALVYHFRTEVGRVVIDLGYDLPNYKLKSQVMGLIEFNKNESRKEHMREKSSDGE